MLHLAAYANPRHALEEPQPYIDTNITGTQRLIEAAEEYDVPVVYASSSCVMHGQPLPWNEHDRPDMQNNPYGWSKRANECQFGHSNIKRSAGLRFFTVYGPYGRPDMALFKFTDAIVKGEAMTLYNFGDMKRDFTYVQDIVNGIELVVNKVVNDEDNWHEIYNIGYGEQVNLLDFVDEIEKNLDRKGERILAPKHPADVPETWSDTTKLQALGYKPTTSVRDGVKEFITWYKSYYGVN
jgi:UDP-glucuronate 4-epimerase